METNASFTEKQAEVINILEWIERSLVQEEKRSCGGVPYERIKEDEALINRLIVAIQNWRN